MNEFHRERVTTMLRNCLRIATFTLAAMLSLPAGAQSWTQVGTLSCRVRSEHRFHHRRSSAHAMCLQSSPGCRTSSTSPILRWRPQYGWPERRRQCWKRAGLGCVCADDWCSRRRARRRICRRFCRCRPWPRCRRECSLGGSNRTIALQPLSVQGSVALNVVAGVSALKLRWH